jgi:hypothetical protein
MIMRKEETEGVISMYKWQQVKALRAKGQASRKL